MQNIIKQAGLKVTHPRTKILEIMENSDGKHLSAEDVYKELIHMDEEIGLATVYRVLTQFESAGLVDRHYFEEGHARFELRKDAHHDHLVCVKCGRVEEFCDDEIERLQVKVAKKKKFTIVGHAHVIYGRCTNPNCKEM